MSIAIRPSRCDWNLARWIKNGFKLAILYAPLSASHLLFYPDLLFPICRLIFPLTRLIGIVSLFSYIFGWFILVAWFQIRIRHCFLLHRCGNLVVKFSTLNHRKADDHFVSVICGFWKKFLVLLSVNNHFSVFKLTGKIYRAESATTESTYHLSSFLISNM